MLVVTQSTIDFTEPFEKCELTAYRDQTGKWTIGWGTTYYPDGTNVKEGDVITQNYADYLIRKTMSSMATSAGHYVKVTLNQNQNDAIMDFVYNLGWGALAGSTLLKRINANPQDLTIADAFLMWDKMHVDGQLVESPDLKLRREKESKLYFS